MTFIILFSFPQPHLRYLIGGPECCAIYLKLMCYGDGASVHLTQHTGYRILVTYENSNTAILKWNLLLDFEYFDVRSPHIMGWRLVEWEMSFIFDQSKQN